MRVRAWLENVILTKLVPPHKPGKLMRWVFKIPIAAHQLGLKFLVPKYVLILTTTGRKSGKPRRTAVEYRDDPSTGTYRVMSGWGDKTDWYRNARANPTVTVQVGKETFKAITEPVAEEDVARTLIEVT